MNIHYIEGGVEDLRSHLDWKINFFVYHFFDPSKALTTISLGFSTNPSLSSLSREPFCNTFKEELVSTNNGPKQCFYTQQRHAKSCYDYILPKLSQRQKNLTHYQLLSQQHSSQIDRQKSLVAHEKTSRISPKLMHGLQNTVIGITQRSQMGYFLAVQQSYSRSYG